MKIEAIDIAGYVEFEFDLPQALLARLVEVLQAVDPVKLNSGSVSQIPEEQGVYQLLLDDEIVYVGKTDSDAGLKNRLATHAKKITHRKGLIGERVTFKAVRVFVFTAMDLESELIRHYGGVGALEWNGSGFGSHDPGKERDTTKIKKSNFDAQFSIDIDREISFQVEIGETAAQVFGRLKSLLPYTIRIQNAGGRSRRPHGDLADVTFTQSISLNSCRGVLAFIVNSLPSGWHATALPGYIIMYKNDDRKFPSGSVIASSP